MQFIWQTGKIYIDEVRAAVAKAGELPMLHVTDFISDMASAYSAAGLGNHVPGPVLSLSSVYCRNRSFWYLSQRSRRPLSKPKRLALVNKNALFHKDAAAKEALLIKYRKTVQHPELLKSLSTNIAKLAFTDSANVIAREVMNWLMIIEREMNVNTLKKFHLSVLEASVCIGTLLLVKECRWLRPYSK